MSPDESALQNDGQGNEASDNDPAALAEPGSSDDPSATVESPPPIDAKSVLKIGLASPVFGWIFLVGLSNLISGSPDLAIYIVFTTGGAIGLVACYAAWKTGGFANIGNLRVATLVSDVSMRFMRTVYNIGGGVMGLGFTLAVFSLFPIIEGAPRSEVQVLFAEIAIGAIVGGFVIQLVTGRAKITRAGRILALKDSLKDNLDSAFTGLAQAQSTLGALRREVEAESRKLDEDLVENAQWELSIRGTDENGRKRYRESVRRTNRKALIATWAGVFVGVGLTELSSAFGFGDLLKSIFHP
jgi:hypothetical protein